MGREPDEINWMFLRNRVQLPSELTRRRRTAAWAQALWCCGGLSCEQQKIFHDPTAVRSSFTTTGFTSKGRPTLKNNLKIRNVSQLSRGSSFTNGFRISTRTSTWSAGSTQPIRKRWASHSLPTRQPGLLPIRISLRTDTSSGLTSAADWVPAVLGWDLGRMDTRIRPVVPLERNHAARERIDCVFDSGRCTSTLKAKAIL